ncbi:MAG: hypothetical protein HDQ97_12060 [Lachnospiraceae bacterium]|nr:hypothetical protein [Lachnospiraceae bacterium]
MGRSIADTKYMNDYSNYNLPELMGVSTDELQELSLEDFSMELNGKRINIHPLSKNGDIVIGAMNANILIETNQRTITIFEYDSHIHIDLSANIIFALYSYGNDKNYRVAFEGNSPDLLVTIVGGRINKSSK